MLLIQPVSTTAKFIVSDWGNKVNSGIFGPLGYMAGGPVRQPYAGVNYIPPCQEIWIWLLYTLLGWDIVGDFFPYQGVRKTLSSHYYAEKVFCHFIIHKMSFGFLREL